VNADTPARPGKAPRSAGRAAALEELGRLFDAARSRGDAAVRVRLAVPVEELRAVARVLGLGQRARRWTDADKVRDLIAAEILRRVNRNDVFLTGPAGGLGAR
jgi:hypothetical protein